VLGAGACWGYRGITTAGLRSSGSLLDSWTPTKLCKHTLGVYQIQRTLPTFLKPIYVVTNVDGACFFLLRAQGAHGSWLVAPKHSLIDIAPNNLTMKLAVAALCATSAAAFAPSQVPAAVSLHAVLIVALWMFSLRSPQRSSLMDCCVLALPALRWCDRVVDFMVEIETRFSSMR